MKLIDKDKIVTELERRMQELHPTNTHKMQVGEKVDRDVLMWLNALTWVKDFLNTLEVKEVDLEKTKWSPSKKQIESLGALVRYNIGVFDYQKLNEVAILYDDLTKILDYETDRQK